MRGPGLEEEIWVALALPHSLVLDHAAALGPCQDPGAWLQPLLPLIGDSSPDLSALGGNKS